jgi:hypothetical protein
MRRYQVRKFECCICNDTIEGEYGNNPDPFNGNKCCDWCNDDYVVQARLQMMAMIHEAREMDEVERAESRDALKLSRDARMAFLKKDAKEKGIKFYKHSIATSLD